MHLRDKRLRFGIKTFTEYFFGRSDTLYFFTDALVLSNPPIGPGLFCPPSAKEGFPVFQEALRG